MELVISDATGLPENAMLSVRIGETKRQGHYKPAGNTFKFPDTGRVSMTVDVYQWLGRRISQAVVMKVVGQDFCGVVEKSLLPEGGCIR